MNTTHASEESLYEFKWLDPDKEVYVLQNKIYPKMNRQFLTFSRIEDVSNNFQDTIGAEVKYNYFFTERWAVELSYSNYKNTDSDTFKNVEKVNGIIPFVRRIDQRHSISAIYSPFYGKINTFNRIFYFDWSFGAGVTYLTNETNINSIKDPNAKNSYRKEYLPGLNAKTSLRIYLNRKYHIDLDYNTDHFKADMPSSNGTIQDWTQNNSLSIGVGLSW
jgi:outer membrane beta-barrel protein